MAMKFIVAPNIVEIHGRLTCWCLANKGSAPLASGSDLNTAMFSRSAGFPEMSAYGFHKNLE
jgi:hypothetical protein